MNTYSSGEWISDWKLRNWIHTVVGNENKWVCVWLCTRIVCYLPQGNKCHNKSWWGKYAIIWLINLEGILGRPSTPLLTSWDRVTRFPNLNSPNCLLCNKNTFLQHFQILLWLQKYTVWGLCKTKKYISKSLVSQTFFLPILLNFKLSGVVYLGQSSILLSDIFFFNRNFFFFMHFFIGFTS